MEEATKIIGTVQSEPGLRDTLSFYISIRGLGNAFCEAAPGYKGTSPKHGDTVLLTGPWLGKVGASPQGWQSSETVFRFDSLEVTDAKA
jgi:hypothetical protein